MLTGMSTSAPTFADAVIRETYRPRTDLKKLTNSSMSSIRTMIASAHKFVLDDDMSAFMADLAHGPFIKNPMWADSTLDAMRHGALLPHDCVWIEVQGHPLKKRTAQLHDDNGQFITDPWGQKYDVDDTADQWGFLLTRHPSSPHVVVSQEFIGDKDSGDVIMIPCQVAWSTVDDVVPWGNAGDTLMEVLSTMAHGIQGFSSPFVTTLMAIDTPGFKRIPRTQLLSEKTGVRVEVPTIILECAGTARYMIALLSTINDIPVIRTDVKPSKGYVARGSYKKFVEHTVLKLNVPQRVSKTRLAAKVTAIARRRAHEVRGHWRVYQRGEGVLCAPSHHAWGAADAEGHAQCQTCQACRTWIAPHQRGDATLGFVTHSYAVTHEVRP